MQALSSCLGHIRAASLAACLNLILGMHLLKFSAQWYVANSATVKPGREQMGYRPDVVVLDRSKLGDEPLWAGASSIVNGTSIPLVIEVVSMNWRTDYDYKFSDYEAMGIREYWLGTSKKIIVQRLVPAKPEAAG